MSRPATSLPLPGARISYQRGFLPPSRARALFARLSHELHWREGRIRLFGKVCNIPRLQAWYGDPDATYCYSGQRLSPLPWHEALAGLRRRLTGELGVEFNSVLANLYRSGADSVGWHSDDEPELGAEPVIASLSLGATRRFLLRPRPDRAGAGHRVRAAIKKSCSLELEAGSLLVMAGPTQVNYQHSLPRTSRNLEARINLSFRWVATGTPLASGGGPGS